MGRLPQALPARIAGVAPRTAKPSKPTTPAPAATAKLKARRRPGPLVSVAWLAEHLDDPDLRLVHVSPDRRVYNKRHIEGADLQRPAQGAGAQGHGPRDRRRRARVARPDPRGGRAGAPALAGRRRRPDRLLRRHRAEPPGDPRLLAAAPVSISRGPAAHPRRRDRSLAARRRRDHDELPEADLADALRTAGRRSANATTP